MQITGWSTEGPKMNPANGTILADTGPADPRQYRFNMLVSASVGARIDMEHRDSTNTVTLRSFPLFVVAGTTFQMAQSGEVQLATDERIRLIINGAVVGVVGGSLFVD